MKKYFKLTLVLVLTMFFITGCTHKIELTPDNEKLSAKLDKINTENINVGYYLSSDKENIYVVTPGGGGDKVGYTPYKDTEATFRTILLKKFKKVYKVSTLYDTELIKEKNIKYIFTYNLQTNSSSDSAFTWPPTRFSISLTCKAINNEGKEIWKNTAYEEGNSTFDEFKHDFSLSARRASEKVFHKLMININDSNAFNKKEI